MMALSLSAPCDSAILRQTAVFLSVLSIQACVVHHLLRAVFHAVFHVVWHVVWHVVSLAVCCGVHVPMGYARGESLVFRSSHGAASPHSTPYQVCL